MWRNARSLVFVATVALSPRLASAQAFTPTADDTSAVLKAVASEMLRLAYVEDSVRNAKCSPDSTPPCTLPDEVHPDVSWFASLADFKSTFALATLLGIKTSVSTQETLPACVAAETVAGGVVALVSVHIAFVKSDSATVETVMRCDRTAASPNLRHAGVTSYAIKRPKFGDWVAKVARRLENTP